MQSTTQFYAEVDKLIKLGISNSPIPTCCAKGCHTCCSEPMYCSMEEVEYMLEGLPPERIEEIKEQSARWMKEFAPFFDAQTKDDDGVEYGVLNSYPYLEKDIKCPMLKDGLCSVYERRPFACRTYFAMGNPEHCKMPHRPKQMIGNWDFSAPPWRVLFHMRYPNKVVPPFDHFGVLLHNKLFGTDFKSSCYRQQSTPQ